MAGKEEKEATPRTNSTPESTEPAPTPTTTALSIWQMRLALVPHSVALRHPVRGTGLIVDVNGDGKIDLTDLELVNQAYRE